MQQEALTITPPAAAAIAIILIIFIMLYSFVVIRFNLIVTIANSGFVTFNSDSKGESLKSK